MSLTARTKLGAYEVIAPLGAGGMGEVYRARDPRLAREVAIKVLAPELASDPSAILTAEPPDLETFGVSIDRTRANRSSMSREAAGAALSIGQRSRLRARDAVDAV